MPVCSLLIVGFRCWISAALRIGRLSWSVSLFITPVFETGTSRVRVPLCTRRVFSGGTPSCICKVSLLGSLMEVIPIYKLLRRLHSLKEHLHS